MSESPSLPPQPSNEERDVGGERQQDAPSSPSTPGRNGEKQHSEPVSTTVSGEGEAQGTSSSPTGTSNEPMASPSPKERSDSLPVSIGSRSTGQSATDSGPLKKPLGQLPLSLQERIDIAKIIYRSPNQGISQSYAGQMTAEGSTSIKNTPRPVVSEIPPVFGSNQPIGRVRTFSGSYLHVPMYTSLHGLSAGRFQTASSKVQATFRNGRSTYGRIQSTSFVSSSTPEGGRSSSELAQKP